MRTVHLLVCLPLILGAAHLPSQEPKRLLVHRQMLFPLKSFIPDISAYFEAAGSSRWELVSIYRFPQHLTARIVVGDGARIVSTFLVSETDCSGLRGVFEAAADIGEVRVFGTRNPSDFALSADSYEVNSRLGLFAPTDHDSTGVSITSSKGTPSANWVDKVVAVTKACTRSKADALS